MKSLVNGTPTNNDGAPSSQYACSMLPFPIYPSQEVLKDWNPISIKYCDRKFSSVSLIVVFRSNGLSRFKNSLSINIRWTNSPNARLISISLENLESNENSRSVDVDFGNKNGLYNTYHRTCLLTQRHKFPIIKLTAIKIHQRNQLIGKVLHVYDLMKLSLGRMHFKLLWTIP